MNPELFDYAKKVQSQKISVNEVWADIIDKFLIDKDEITMQERLIKLIIIKILNLLLKLVTLMIKNKFF